MKQLLRAKQWGWKSSGVALGIAFFVAVLAVKPIGVSTQFVIFDGILMDLVAGDTVVPDETAASGYSSPNAYLNKSGGKYAKHIAQPLNYSFVFVLFMAVGGFIAARLSSERPDTAERVAPPVWRKRFGKAPGLRYALAFLGGFFVLFGSRLAGGCTSGHMMSGMMQTSLSGYLFALGAFAVAVPTALLIYRKKGE